ncbi:ArsA family ATPase [Nocardioides solisilvae]|uniref:ArsA family ATPase n=1 Tax=Nocardioides solisilvae TaxID=1542435 RepID=UPI000D744A30|nr:ArsA family ATPase [Nocardioides solisilvae]
MRVLLFTGKGGVGKSTVAAATAAASARAGLRTLVLSTDAAHSLADAFAVPGRSEPDEVADRLFVQQVDCQRRFEESWGEVQEYLRGALDLAGVDPVAAEELTVLPGAEEVMALLELRRHVRSGEWDVVVVDCAPTAETLRLLALPEALGWYLRRVLPGDRRLVRALVPALGRAAGVPLPGEPVLEALDRLHRELDEVRQVLTSPGASVRLVLTPERLVLAEARRLWTMLSLFGYTVDGVVSNRVFPTEGHGAWVDGWVRAQGEVLADVERSFAGLRTWRVEYQPDEPVGEAALAALGAGLYGTDDPLAVVGRVPPFEVVRTAGGFLLFLRLPLVSAGDVDLVRRDDDLVVTVAGHRRVVPLPAALARLRVAGARVEDGRLQARFEEAG